ncbi:hypothetical protein J437_LFUL008920 [Ladona fulva]|uniref:Uncharacterized protein n=1 Tax=Ladona fulva TaxID=123851 RepID=A0A8K0KBK2_LADFU|nr:hypothetical protein J437_LFUL008920 [Ladona fulva]
MQYQVEVRNITQKISSLSEKLDTVGSLGEPRENAFLTCEFKLSNNSHADKQSLSTFSESLGAISSDDDKEKSLEKLRELLKTFGRVRTSTTFPGLCNLVLENMSAKQMNGQEVGAAAPVTACLEATAMLYTVDYHGVPRSTGGDPLRVELVQETSSDSVEEERGRQLDVRIRDIGDGSYHLTFRPPAAGTYALKVNVFDRPIRDCPFRFEATEHNNPLRVFGSHGSGKDGFHQPVAVAVDDTCNSPKSSLIYVVDTGNSRIKVLTADLDFLRHVECEDLAGCSCTGVALARKPDGSKGENGKWSPSNLVLVNWRTKVVSEITAEGETVKSFSYPSFVEPVAVAVDSRGNILVADNGTSSVIVFDSEGKVLFVIGGASKGEDGSEKVSSGRIQGTSSGSRGIHQRSGTSSAGAAGKAKGRFGLISSVAVGPGDEIIVSDSRIQIFSSSGEYLRDVESRVPHNFVVYLQELLFCETCDTVFCTQCTAANGGFSAGVHGTSSSSSNGGCEHTVIPFSIAIKRMSEILLYKANECISKAYGIILIL